jgi:hypothetical protein
MIPRLISLPHNGGRLSRRRIRALIRDGPAYAYCPFPVTAGENLAIIRHACRHGLTVNAVASDGSEADRLAVSGLLTVLPLLSHHPPQTPAGRPIIPCPGGDCADCRLCWDRSVGIILAIPEALLV